MGYTLNVDQWDWIDPETQKVTRLRRGDKVPSVVLAQEGIDEEELTKGNFPILLKGEDTESSPAPPAKK
jgi:hypothetical protein